MTKNLYVVNAIYSLLMILDVNECIQQAVILATLARNVRNNPRLMSEGLLHDLGGSDAVV